MSTPPRERMQRLLDALPEGASYLDVLDGIELLYKVDAALGDRAFVEADEAFAAIRRQMTRGPVERPALQKALQRRPGDYAPWGDVPRRAEDRDCTAGCRHAAWLRFPVGEDWCVCTNATSHRSGLLTEAGQGCRGFEPPRR